jgi:DNA-binding transcriptional MocR family regulator
LNNRTPFSHSPFPPHWGKKKVLLDTSVELAPVVTDKHGLSLEDLEAQILRRGIPDSANGKVGAPYSAMIYLVSAFNNPTGRCYERDRCVKILEVRSFFFLSFFFFHFQV